PPVFLAAVLHLLDDDHRNPIRHDLPHRPTPRPSDRATPSGCPPQPSSGPPSTARGPTPGAPSASSGSACATSPASGEVAHAEPEDRKSTRLNSSHVKTSYADICMKKNTCSDA